MGKNVTKVSDGGGGLAVCERERCGKPIRYTWGRPRRYCCDAGKAQQTNSTR